MKIRQTLEGALLTSNPQTYKTLGYSSQEIKEKLYDLYEIGKWQRETELAALADAKERGIDGDGDESKGFSMVCVSALPDGSRVMALFNTRVSLHANVWSSEFLSLRICICPTAQAVRELGAEMARVWNAAG